MEFLPDVRSEDGDGMRFWYAAFAIILWTMFVIWVTKGNVAASRDVQILSTAIIAAGAMAGGD